MDVVDGRSVDVQYSNWSILSAQMYTTVPGITIDCQFFRSMPIIFGSRALALADPYCQSRWNSVCLWVCLSATLRSNISKTKGARRKVTIGSL